MSMNRRHFLRLASVSPWILGVPSAMAAPLRKPSRKKGLCMVAKADGVWLERVRAVNASWFYSWGGTRPGITPKELEFVPMIWGYWGNKESIAKVGAAAKEAGCGELLGFNEPDERKQSNLSVAKALEVWPELMKTGLRLGSPGCVHADREWMKEFMAGVKKRRLRVDFVCVHSYGGTNVDAFMNRLESIHRMYRLPLWITEFACGDWQAKAPAQNRNKPEQVARFMEGALKQLERARFVERYAWYPAPVTSAALGTSALFLPDGKLTPLGEIYRSV